MTAASIFLDGVSVMYGGHTALDDVTGCFRAGSNTAVVGPNGSGKSTLIKALVGEIPLSRGRIDCGGLAARDIGYLPQASQLDRQFPITVAETIILGAWHQTGAFNAVHRNDACRARHALEVVGLQGLESRRISNLSGGQFQRVMFAQLFMQEAPVVLLDEPFVGIDEHTRNDLFKIIQLWQDTGRTVIAVLHELDDVKTYFPETLLLARQAVGWGPTESVLSVDNMQQVFLGASQAAM